jgi:hypothetical protein
MESSMRWAASLPILVGVGCLFFRLWMGGRVDDVEMKGVRQGYGKLSRG